MDDTTKIQNSPPDMRGELSKTRGDGIRGPGKECQDSVSDVSEKESRQNASGKRTMKTIVIPDYIEDDYNGDAEPVKFELGGEPILLSDQSRTPEFGTGDGQKRAGSREKSNYECQTFLPASHASLPSETRSESNNRREPRDDQTDSASKFQGHLEPVEDLELKDVGENFPESLTTRMSDLKEYAEDERSGSSASANQFVAEKQEPTDTTKFDPQSKDETILSDGRSEFEDSKLVGSCEDAQDKQPSVKHEPAGSFDASLTEAQLPEHKSSPRVLSPRDGLKSLDDDDLLRADVTIESANAASTSDIFPGEIKSAERFPPLDDSEGNIDVDSTAEREKILTKMLEDGMLSVDGAFSKIITNQSVRVSSVIVPEPVEKEPEVTFKIVPQLTDQEEKEKEYYDSGLDESTQIKENGVAYLLNSNVHSTPKKESGLPKKEVMSTKSTESTPSKLLHKKDMRNEVMGVIRSTESSPSTPLRRMDKKTTIADKTADISRWAKNTHAENGKLSWNGENKKVPMNKMQVGTSPSPNLKVVKSKVGSLDYSSYKPGGGSVKIASQKLKWEAKSKVGSLENASYKPGGGDKKIENQKLNFLQNAHSKVASTTNIKHKPGGGLVKIENRKLELKVQSKVGSLDNVKHRPGGGEKKIFEDKEYLRNIEHYHHPRDDKSDEDRNSGKLVDGDERSEMPISTNDSGLSSI